MKLNELPLGDLLAAIRSPSPTPGGGSAAALAGALGASLLSMVAAMQKHRAASEEDVERLRAAGHRSAALAGQMEALVDRDAAAYDLVVAAYRLPKASEEDKATRRLRIQEALAAAADAPLDVMRRCAEAIEAAAVVAAFGNPNAASDVAVGLELLGAAARGAKLNVDVNLSSLEDAASAERVRAAGARLEAECAAGIRAALARLADADDGR